MESGEHTKGELKIDHYGIYVDEKDGVRVYLAKICSMPLGYGSHEDNSKRFVKCWNSHDDLLAACEKSLEIYDVIDGLLATDEQVEAVVEAMYRPIKAAIAKAKPGKE